MIRVNLHDTARRAGYPVPAWVTKLLTELVETVSADFQINPNDVHRYFFPIPENADILAIEFRKRMAIDVTSYKILDVPSWGLIFNTEDPMVVEYKLKYSKGNSDNEDE